MQLYAQSNDSRPPSLLEMQRRWQGLRQSQHRSLRRPSTFARRCELGILTLNPIPLRLAGSLSPNWVETTPMDQWTGAPRCDQPAGNSRQSISASTSRQILCPTQMIQTILRTFIPGFRLPAMVSSSFYSDLGRMIAIEPFGLSRH